MVTMRSSSGMKEDVPLAGLETADARQDCLLGMARRGQALVDRDRACNVVDLHEVGKCPANVHTKSKCHLANLIRYLSRRLRTRSDRLAHLLPGRGSCQSASHEGAAESVCATFHTGGRVVARGTTSLKRFSTVSFAASFLCEP